MRREHAVQVRKECGAISPEEEHAERRFAALVHRLLDGMRTLDALTAEEAARRAAIVDAEQTLRERMERAMRFVQATFGSGQELLIFLTQLETLPDGMRFSQACPCYAAFLKDVE